MDLFTIATTLTDWHRGDELLESLRRQVAVLGEVASRDAPAASLLIAPTVLDDTSSVGWYSSGPPGSTPLTSDVAWSPDFVEIVPPERVTRLEDWGPDAGGGTAVAPMAITSPFRVLSAAGLERLQAIASELEAGAVDFANDRVPRHSRGAIYRSEFLRGLHTDPTILAFLSSLAGIRLEAHPNGHHASHFNFAPTDPSKAVDPWHTDVTAFDCIMHVFDIDGMQGGRFEYFDGNADEGRDILLRGDAIAQDRIVTPEFPAAGWMVMQQGNRVLHRASPLTSPWRRCTYVPSFIAHHPTIDDPDVLATLVTIDGPQAAPVEWARHRALVAARRLAEAATLGDRAVRIAAAEQAVVLRAAVDGIERPVGGRFVNYELPAPPARASLRSE